MITLKQIEALYWIVELGTFERAASKLNTTQSAISKRIAELEAASRLALFDRSLRGARLTDQGEQLLALGRDMLGLQERILELKDGKRAPTRRLCLGVTELTALTWLPRLVAAIRRLHPTAVIEAEVEMSRDLFERLLEGTIDLIIIPDALSDPAVTATPLADVTNVWMARPGLVRSRKTLSLAQLADYPILVQGSRSGSGLYFARWLRSIGHPFPRVLSSDSLTAMVGMTVAGLGVSYLPHRCYQPLIDEGKLVVVPTRPKLPPVPYAAMFRNDRPSAFVSAVVDLAQQVCDFSRQLQ